MNNKQRTVIKVAEITGGELRRSFVGRNMWGGPCMAIVASDTEIVVREAERRGLMDARVQGNTVFWPTVKEAV